MKLHQLVLLMNLLFVSLPHLFTHLSYYFHLYSHLFPLLISLLLNLIFLALPLILLMSLPINLLMSLFLTLFLSLLLIPLNPLIIPRFPLLQNTHYSNHDIHKDTPIHKAIHIHFNKVKDTLIHMN